jgi:hypothetical protein
MRLVYPALSIRVGEWISEDKRSDPQWAPERTVQFAVACGLAGWALIIGGLWLLLFAVT